MTLLQQLIEKKNAERLTVREISTQLGIPVERINSWIKNGSEPKYSDGVLIKKWLNGNLEVEVNSINEDKVVYKTLKDDYLDIIKNQAQTIASQQRTIEKLVDMGNVNANANVVV